MHNITKLFAVTLKYYGYVKHRGLDEFANLKPIVNGTRLRGCSRSFLARGGIIKFRRGERNLSSVWRNRISK